MKQVLFVLCVILSLNKSIVAQQLSLDNSFGNNGTVVKTLNGDALPYSIACQTDGKLIVAGYHGWYMNHWSVLSRFNADGSVDSAYGVNGSAEPAIPPAEYQHFEDVAIQPDNKAVAVGPLDDSSEYYLFATRFLESGQPDSTFDMDGLALFGKGVLYSVALQQDGKIVMGGGKLYGQYYRFAMIRCQSNGMLDSSFGTNGIVSINFGGNSRGSVSDIVIQPDGKILATGEKDTLIGFGGWSTKFLVARYNINGSLDSTFGSNGIVWDIPEEVICLQKDGKILLGSSWLARYNQNGSIDSTFGVAGKINKPCYAVGVDSFNRIVLIGRHWMAPDYKFKVSIFDSSGIMLDTIVTDFAGDNEPKDLCFQPDGKIVVLGRTYRGVTGSYPAFIMSRYYYGLTSGVTDIINDITVHPFPNPFSTQLTFSLADNEQTTISLYDFLGQQVLRQIFTNSTTINTEQLADGIYFYELRNSKGTLKTGKVIKQ